MSSYQTDGSIHIQEHGHDVSRINQQARDAVPVPSMGVQFAGYAFLGVFVVLGLFLLCLSADAMGRSFAKVGKRLLLADGSGHSSMLTEFVIFALVLGLVCGLMAHAFSMYKPVGEATAFTPHTTDE